MISRKENTALILIGYQNDYFSPTGCLYESVDSFSQTTLSNTLKMLNRLHQTTIFTTPMIYSANYNEISEDIGILKTIKEKNAFQKGSVGVKTISAFDNFKDNIIEVPSQSGINAFFNTNLDQLLKIKKIEHVIIAGALCAINIDATAKSAKIRGYDVSIISDAISGRTKFEVSFYVNNIFPLYANLITSDECLNYLQ
jgi:nicotinamidase-related amidase